MVYNGNPYEQMDDLGGKPTIFGNLHMVTWVPMGKCSDKILLEGPVDGASGVTGILR